jgi:hypothetical protein
MSKKYLVNRKRRRKKEHQQKWQKNGDEYPAPEAEEVRACSSVTKRIQKVNRSLLIPFLIKIILFRIVIKNQFIPINIPGHHHIFQEITIPFSDC